MRCLILYFLIALPWGALAVDEHKFRTCAQTAFCKRNRDEFEAQDYSIDFESVKTDNEGASLTAELLNGRWPLQNPMELKVQVLSNGIAKINVREINGKYERWEVQDVIRSKIAETSQTGLTWTTDADTKVITAEYGQNFKLVLSSAPFTVKLLVDGETAVAINTDGKLMFEQYREKNPAPEQASEEGENAGEAAVTAPQAFPYDSDGMWEDSFSGHTDVIRKGPASIAADISFPGSKHLYGIPEHASDFALKNTDGSEGAYSEPYRLYNLDVFEYILDVPMALYGAVPFIMSHSAKASTGVLWLNSAETFIDIADTTVDDVPGKTSRWISESGVIDIYLLPGSKPADVYFQYAQLTGSTTLPQRFATAYHQCRWNYNDEADVASVDGGFDEHDIPYDVLWLDIEHTDGKKYFTWDKSNFPDPVTMQNKLAAKGRKMVTIVDPHIKREDDYKVHAQAKDKFYVENNAEKGGDFEGWCWPGSVSYLDFFRKDVRDYWANLFGFGEYLGSTPSLYTWNDMNEPSVFNGPEVTMPKDALHLNGQVEHRDVHNMYGYYVQMATEQGQYQRDKARPFVLTRSFFAGTQRYCAVWTGDNLASWDHLKASVPMLLSLNVAGIQFSGADVGGFFGDPDAELLTRWYQVAAFQPFFRGHAHIDTKRREPWLFGEPYTTQIRTAIRQRYKFLPYVYTTFWQSHQTGVPVMRPLWTHYPYDEETFDLESEFLLGGDLLVVPVVEAGQVSVEVYIPGEDPWYDIRTSQPHTGKFLAAAPADSIPVFQRGGSIITKKERARRSSSLMIRDPYTLVVALDNTQSASGFFYLDDGSTYNYQEGQYSYRRFMFTSGVLSAGAGYSSKGDQFDDGCVIERVVIMGVQEAPTSVSLQVGESATALGFTHEAGVLTIRKPDVSIVADFTITLA